MNFILLLVIAALAFDDRANLKAYAMRIRAKFTKPAPATKPAASAAAPDELVAAMQEAEAAHAPQAAATQQGSPPAP